MKRLILAAVGVLVLSGCNAGKNQTNIELIRQMMDQESIKAQEGDPKAKDHLAMRLPPENTIPQGYEPYPYHLNAEAASQNLTNPLRDDFNPEVVSRGKKYYTIYCSVCHGNTGKGDGTVADKMILKPVPLVSGKVLDFTDGRIYHAITDGYGVMGSYANQILNKQDRWAVVNYVRTLQKKASGE